MCSSSLGACLYTISRVFCSPLYCFRYNRRPASINASTGQPPLSQCIKSTFCCPSRDNQLSLDRRKWWIISKGRTGQPSYCRGYSITVMSYWENMSEIWLRLSPSLKLNTMKEASGKWSCSWATIPPI